MLVVTDVLGVIHDIPRPIAPQLEENDSLESLALSLSMARIQPDVPNESAPISPQPDHPKPRPPTRPIDSPTGPPDARPKIQQREAHRAAAYLPVLFPPVGHEWNRSALAARAQRPPRRRRRPRVWFAMPGSFAYFPPNGLGYERLRRRRFAPPPPYNFRFEYRYRRVTGRCRL